MIDDIYFEITDGPDMLRIKPLNWTHTEVELDWDKNWVHSQVTVKGGAFHGQFYCDLVTTDFELFKRALQKMHDSLNGEAEFKTLEGQIQIKIEGNGLGHFTVDCELMDETGNKLSVAMAFDQTQMPDLVKQLEKIVQQFPIQGTELKVVNE